MDPQKRRLAVLLGVGALLLAAYVTFFTDVVFPPPIGVSAGSLHEAAGEPPYARPLMIFALDGEYWLSELRVAAVGPDGEVGESVWELIGSPRSAPVDTFVYGATLAGLGGADGGDYTHLEPGRRYRIEVRAGRRFGSLDFITPGAAP